MVGSVGTRQPAARCSQACRRACPAHDASTPAGVHLPAATPRSLAAPPTNSLSAVRVRGRRAVVKDVGVRPPNDGQAAADDARPRPPERRKTLPQRRCTSVVRACRSPTPREVTLHLLTHAWVARAIRLPAVLVVQRARLRDVLARVHLPAAPAPPPAPCAGVAARAVPRGTARWPLRASSRSVGVKQTCKR